MSRRNLTLLVALSAIWGASFLFIKIGVRELSPSVVVLGRLVVGAGVLLPLAAFRGGLAPLRGRLRAVALLSLFNMAGRFFWASMSDFLGRKVTYFIFFILGALLFFFLPLTRQDHLNSVPLFVGIAAVILSMYGGGFATIPAYLKDLFGGFNVSAIHGRLLTAWSTAGIVGPLIVNGILDHYVAAHRPKQDAYPLILHIMTGLLVVGFIANLLVTPVSEKFWIKEADADEPVGAAAH